VKSAISAPDLAFDLSEKPTRASQTRPLRRRANHLHVFALSCPMKDRRLAIATNAGLLKVSLQGVS
jgi:hypothetical protein